MSQNNMSEEEKKVLQAKHRVEEAEARNRVKERKSRTRRLIQEGALKHARLHQTMFYLMLHIQSKRICQKSDIKIYLEIFN